MVTWKPSIGMLKTRKLCIGLKEFFQNFMKYIYLTTTVHETFNDNEIKLVDSFVEDLLSKDDVSNVYVKEIKTISHTTFYRK